MMDWMARVCLLLRAAGWPAMYIYHFAFAIEDFDELKANSGVVIGQR